jgi:excisionase family DNA binding protein
MTVQLPSHAVHADGSLSVQEAAEVLGCSEKTIRRRIKAGSLTAHRLPTSQGYEWRVHVDGAVDQVTSLPAVQVNGQNGHLPGDADQVDTNPSGQVDSAPAPPNEAGNEALIKALDFAERLQRENMELAGRVGFLQAKLQTAEEQILALNAGNAAPEQHEQSPDPPMRAASRPWWKFWETD